MWVKVLVSIISFSLIISINTLFAEEPLEIVSKEGSHSVGHDQNMLGINAYKKRKFDQALKHFQTASVVDSKKGEIGLLEGAQVVNTAINIIKSQK